MAPRVGVRPDGHEQRRNRHERQSRGWDTHQRGDRDLTPVLSMSPATSLANGYLSSADWSTFNNKLPP
jgi:hypothetical protein